MTKMYDINGARYREEDAKRLGLIKDGKVITARSVRRAQETSAPAGAAGQSAVISTSSANTTPGENPEGGENPDENPDGRPNKGAKKEAWITYAKAQGKTDEELKDLKRDEIAELFPSE